MKNIIRALVVVLTLTGAAVAAHVTVATETNPMLAHATKASAFPVPTCPPDDPNGCGLDGL